MLDGAFVIDAVAHSYDLRPSNFASGRYSEAVTGLIFGAHTGLSPEGYRIPEEHFLRDWSVEETANLLFVESDYDMACHHVLQLNAYRDGGSGLAKAREAKQRWPDRFIVYAGVDPMAGNAALEFLEQQVEELDPVGLKLYPNSWSADSVRGWLMDDPEIAFPLFERAQQLGLGVVAIHKALPLGPVPMKHYRMDDIDAAADAFPDLKFEVVHGGMAFIEETAWQLARYPNVYVNLEVTASLTVSKPAQFTQAIAGMIGPSGEGAFDRLLWGTGTSVWHPGPPLEWFWNEFRFPDEMVEGLGLPQIDEAAKRKILGENYANLVGIDLADAKARIADDEFAKRRSQGKPAPYSTTMSAGTAT
jgi:predicted TIM-barrel fold metal-dependent hydrolase